MSADYLSTTQGGWTQTLKRVITLTCSGLSWFDYAFACALLGAAIFAEMKFSAFMDSYEQLFYLLPCQCCLF